MDELEVDAIMRQIPAGWRSRWCESEACACMGCVQIGNRKVIAEKIGGQTYRGDPEYIDENKLQAHGEIYRRLKVSREDWLAWMARQPTPPAP